MSATVAVCVGLVAWYIKSSNDKNAKSGASAITIEMGRLVDDQMCFVLLFAVS